jgi:hypothetical protein
MNDHWPALRRAFAAYQATSVEEGCRRLDRTVAAILTRLRDFGSGEQY